MTHADIFVQMIAEHGHVSLEEARFVFEDFKASFPEPEFLDRELSETESETVIKLYRKDRTLLQLIANMMLRYDDLLPSA